MWRVALRSRSWPESRLLSRHAITRWYHAPGRWDRGHGTFQNVHVDGQQLSGHWHETEAGSWSEIITTIICVNSLWPSDVIWHFRTWVNIGSGNGLLPDSNKPLPEPMLIYHQRGLVAFTGGQYHRKCSRYLSLIPVWKLEQLECLRSEDTPRRLMITHTIESYWIPSQKKTKSKLQI